MTSTLAPTHSAIRVTGVPASSAHVMNVCRVQWNLSGRTPFGSALRLTRSHMREKFRSIQKRPSGEGNTHSGATRSKHRFQTRESAWDPVREGRESKRLRHPRCRGRQLARGVSAPADDVARARLDRAAVEGAHRDVGRGPRNAVDDVGGCPARPTWRMGSG